MKKFVLVVLILAVLVAAGIRYVSQKAPEYLREAIQRALNKPVKIGSIDYQFPWTFELKQFEVLETEEPFRDESCFSVDRVLVQVSPMSLSTKELILDNVDATQAVLVIRNRGERLFHALSSATTLSTGKMTPTEEVGSSPAASPLPLLIHRFHLGSSQFQWVDYDAEASGFVVALSDIEANIKDIALPLSEDKTIYRIDAKLPQGRGQKAASIKLSGWTRFASYESDAMLTAQDLHLPFFKTYLTQVTPADIEDGTLSLRGALSVHDKNLTANTDLELTNLIFRSYEDQDQLFGMKADEILNFLKDQSGRLKFQIVLQWPLDQRVEKRKLIRRAIEESIKKTLLGNAGNILEKTLKSISESGMDGAKDDWADTLKKVKNLLQ